MWVLLLAAQIKALCPTTTYFTQCDISLKKTAIITSTPDCTQYPVKIESVPCTKDCPPGTFFEVTQSKQDCSLCPAGSFSVGGGFAYGREGVPWNLALRSILNDCWMKHGMEEYHNYACIPWQVENGVLSSNGTANNGKFNPYENSTYTASLLFGLKIVKPGNFSIKYRKDTYWIHGKRVGKLAIFKNFEKVLEDNEVDQSSWKDFIFPLEVGFVEVAVDFVTQKSEIMTNPKAYISEVRVTGTQFADSQCYACPYGGAAEGATKCEICGFNEYLEDGLCKPCQEGFYSYKGSVSSSACLESYPCTEKDYRPVYSQCVDSERNLTFEWRTPIFCNTSNYILPALQLVPCEQCKEGYFANSNQGVITCETCKAGYVLNQTCKPCPAGTFAKKQLNITDWSDLPTNFSTTCKTFHGAPCLHSLGWIPSTDYLTTGLSRHNDTELFLEILIYIHSNLGSLKVDYSFETKAGGQIDVYVDGHQLNEWTSENAGLNTVHLQQGLHVVTLAYWNKNNGLEEVRINSVELFGTEQGSALTCLLCEEGFTSTEGATSCVPCPPGSSSNSERTLCRACLENTFSFKPGGKCVSCPAGTHPNSDRTYCIASSSFYLNNSEYNLNDITGVDRKNGGSICDLDSTKQYCHQTFYGPIPGNSSEFYLSVLNPSQLELPSSEYVYKNSTGYAYLIYDSQITGQCFEKKKILNLGKTVLGIEAIKNGFTVSYSFGDECGNGRFYGSNISFLCDKDTGIGWPILEYSSRCFYGFRWNSIYGCSACRPDQTKKIKSACVNGKRTVKIVSKGDCNVNYSIENIQFTESCSEFNEALKTRPMIIGLILLAFLILISIISTVVYFKYKRGFDRLKLVAGTN